MIFNQFAEMGNPLWHYQVTGNALIDKMRESIEDAKAELKELEEKIRSYE